MANSRISANYYLAPPEMTPAQFAGLAAKAGAQGVAFTLPAVQNVGAASLASIAGDNGLFISTLNSAGYFTWTDPSMRARQAATNTMLVEAAARMEVEYLVVITGGMGTDGQTLEAARQRIADGFHALHEEAQAAGVRLALEPIHPADIVTKGCINSIGAALDLVRDYPDADVILDLYHSAWDHDLWRAPQMLGDRLAVVQLCDWREPAPELKSVRDLPGDGSMDLAGWIQALKASGYRGTMEFEMFDWHRAGRSVEHLLAEGISRLQAMLSPA